MFLVIPTSSEHAEPYGSLNYKNLLSSPMRSTVLGGQGWERELGEAARGFKLVVPTSRRFVIFSWQISVFWRSHSVLSLCV